MRLLRGAISKGCPIACNGSADHRDPPTSPCQRSIGTMDPYPSASRSDDSQISRVAAV